MRGGCLKLRVGRLVEVRIREVVYIRDTIVNGFVGEDGI